MKPLLRLPGSGSVDSARPLEVASREDFERACLRAHAAASQAVPETDPPFVQPAPFVGLGEPLTAPRARDRTLRYTIARDGFTPRGDIEQQLIEAARRKLGVAPAETDVAFEVGSAIAPETPDGVAVPVVRRIPVTERALCLYEHGRAVWTVSAPSSLTGFETE